TVPCDDRGRSGARRGRLHQRYARSTRGGLAGRGRANASRRTAAGDGVGPRTHRRVPLLRGLARTLAPHRPRRPRAVSLRGAARRVSAVAGPSRCVDGRGPARDGGVVTTVVTIVGTRPQFIKASALSVELRRRYREVLVHTGQHYDEGLVDRL